jgi:DNA-binding CsgD family transcriptional regulator
VSGNQSQWELTERECEIVTLVAEGLTIREISERLEITQHTVSAHLKHARQRTNARNTNHLVAIAFDHGWIR